MSPSVPRSTAEPAASARPVYSDLSQKRPPPKPRKEDADWEQLGPAARIIVWELVLAVLMQKVAIPLGESQVQIVLPMHLCMTALLIKRGLIGLNKVQCLLYTLTVGLALLGHVAAPKNEFSFPAMMLFAFMYLPFCFSIGLPKHEYRALLAMYQKIALVVCGLVGLDWVLQFVGLSMPNMEVLMPHAMVFDGFAYIQPLVWGSHLMKPNAIFFLETSTVGTFLATALVIELFMFQRRAHLIIFLTAMLATFSGSGMLMVAVCAPVLLPYLSRQVIVGLLLAACIGVPVAMGLGVFDNVAKRSDELERSDSSGYYRFVAPMLLMEEALAREPAELLWGAGAGTAPKGFNIIWTPESKALHEYGLPFAVSLLVLMFTVFYGQGRPVILGWFLMIQYHFVGGGFALPTTAVTIWTLVGAFRIYDEHNEAESARTAPFTHALGRL